MPGYLQRWQYASQAEKNLQAESDLCQMYGFEGIAAKALDGTMWMSNFDPNPDALGSVDQVARQAQFCHDRGLKFVVWMNPLQIDMPTQARIAIDCAGVCDGVCFDTEPYAHFLGAWPPVGLCRSYMETIKGSVSADTLLIWQPDPRPAHLLELRIDEWAPYMTHYSPQNYVNDFYWTPTPDLFRLLQANAAAVAAQYGMRLWPTLPGNADLSLLPEDAIRDLTSFVVWRIGSTPADILGYLGGIPLVTQEPEQPVEDTEVAELREKIKAREIYIADIADRIVADRLEQVIGTLQSIIAETQAEREQILGPRPPRAVSLREPATADGDSQRPLRKPDYSGNITEGANPH